MEHLKIIRMSKKEESLTPEERLQMENNLLKSKLIAEHKGTFSENEESALSPEVENEWLNSMYNFEQAFKNAKTVPLYKFIGEPAFKPSAELDKGSVEKELERLQQIMADHGVVLDCICEYEDRVIYEFITQELFNHEMEDVKIKGMTTNFIYEEFHPNHDHDLRKLTNDFFDALLKRKWNEYDEMLLHEEMLIATDKRTTRDDFIKQIELFQNGWKQFYITKLEIVNVQFDEAQGDANVKISLEYDAISRKKETVRFGGESSLDFVLEYDWWSVRKLLVPGFNDHNRS